MGESTHSKMKNHSTILSYEKCIYHFIFSTIDGSILRIARIRPVWALKNHEKDTSKLIDIKNKIISETMVLAGQKRFLIILMVTVKVTTGTALSLILGVVNSLLRNVKLKIE